IIIITLYFMKAGGLYAVQVFRFYDEKVKATPHNASAAAGGGLPPAPCAFFGVASGIFALLYWKGTSQWVLKTDSK
ncbi:MAG: hypothetical protein LUC40_00890, partial [Oscillospiraceae bacterium]|nr:hypothetical protein [Oscillospiraceae bacterium]